MVAWIRFFSYSYGYMDFSALSRIRAGKVERDRGEKMNDPHTLLQARLRDFHFSQTNILIEGVLDLLKEGLVVEETHTGRS